MKEARKQKLQDINLKFNIRETKRKLKKLEELRILRVIRQRRGLNAEDASQDEDISKMNSDQILKDWSAWHLGCPSWWVTMKGMFDKLENY